MEPKARRARSSLLLRVSELCKARSVGVAPSGGEKPKADSNGESSEDGSNLRVHPQQVLDSEACGSSGCCEQAVAVKVLDAISDLKLAYVELQEAHVPYDPEKIKFAGELVAAELESIIEMEDLYANVKKWSMPMYQSSVSMRIQEHQKLSVELQAVIRKKDAEVVRLKSEIDELERKDLELKERIDQNASCKEGNFIVRGQMSPDMLAEVFELTSKSIRDFSRLIARLMKVSGWNLDEAVCSIDKSVIYKKRAHKKYAVESYFACAMLMGAQDEYFPMDRFDHIMSFRDPYDAVTGDRDSSFGRFCREKFLAVVPSSMEDLFFGNLDHRAFVKSGGHPRTLFYQSFVTMARYVWALLAIARSLSPRAEMFYIQSCGEFRKDYMESVVPEATADEEQKQLMVGFTVMPGFKIGCTIVRCRVYLSKIEG